MSKVLWDFCSWQRSLSGGKLYFLKMPPFQHEASGAVLVEQEVSYNKVLQEMSCVIHSPPARTSSSSQLKEAAYGLSSAWKEGGTG